MGSFGSVRRRPKMGLELGVFGSALVRFSSSALEQYGEVRLTWRRVSSVCGWPARRGRCVAGPCTQPSGAPETPSRTGNRSREPAAPPHLQRAHSPFHQFTAAAAAFTLTQSQIAAQFSFYSSMN